MTGSDRLILATLPEGGTTAYAMVAQPQAERRFEVTQNPEAGRAALRRW